MLTRSNDDSKPDAVAAATAAMKQSHVDFALAPVFKHSYKQLSCLHASQNLP